MPATRYSPTFVPLVPGGLEDLMRQRLVARAQQHEQARVSGLSPIARQQQDALQGTTLPPDHLLGVLQRPTTTS